MLIERHGKFLQLMLESLDDEKARFASFFDYFFVF